jgi:hypothetical protein
MFGPIHGGWDEDWDGWWGPWLPRRSGPMASPTLRTRKTAADRLRSDPSVDRSWSLRLDDVARRLTLVATGCFPSPAPPVDSSLPSSAGHVLSRGRLRQYGHLRAMPDEHASGSVQPPARRLSMCKRLQRLTLEGPFEAAGLWSGWLVVANHNSLVCAYGFR